jgi:ABC-2 type transport system permease protein
VTLATKPWPAYRQATTKDNGTRTVWRLELAKLTGLLRVRVIAAGCLVMPFLAVWGLNLQSATPGDTAFGQWVHVSGFAVPMVVLGFGGQWLLPVLTAVVAGDIYSSEDHFGTWKTVMTRSRTRGELFTGKFLAAVTFAVTAMLTLTATDLIAALTAGAHPVVGLGGQLVPAGHAAQLVVLSWLSTIPPVLGFTALAVFASVASRNSVAGIGAPVLIAVLMQIVTLLNLPVWGQLALLSTPFVTWHGFWASPAFYRPFWLGLITCAAWFTLCAAASWLIFRRRTIEVAP